MESEPEESLRPGGLSFRECHAILHQNGSFKLLPTQRLFIGGV